MTGADAVTERLVARLRQLISDEELIPPDGRVLVALSGGADSVALTHLLHALAPTAGFTLAGVVHVNHQLRPAADADEQFCRALAERLSIPIDVTHVDVADLARRRRISIEEAGHRVRYAAYDVATRRLDADRVVTAHTRDDQAETYLMRLLRGAGPDGLAGIRPRSGRVIRPALHISRAELRVFLDARAEGFREDETNQDLRVTRNRVRHELIPLLKRRFSPSVVDVLARTSTIARGDAEWLDAEVSKIAPSLVSYHEGEALVDVDQLRRQPVAVARRLVRRALEHVAGRASEFDQVERFLSLARQPARVIGEADFPGCRVERRGSHLHVTAPRQRRSEVPGRFRYELEVPGCVKIPEAGLEISANPVVGPAGDEPFRARGGAVAVAAAGLTSPLIVRSWQAGDAVRPLGLDGHKKLQDLFVDRKVSRAARHTVPIVADKQRGIVWVVGHTVAEDFRVTAGTEGMLILKAVELGGAG